MYTEDNNEGIYVERQTRVPIFSMTYGHFHPYCEIFYLRTGSCVYSVDGESHRLQAGDLFLIAPGDVHSTRYEGIAPCERTVVYCLPESLSGLCREAHPDLLEKLSHTGRAVLSEAGRRIIDPLLDAMLEENNAPDPYSHVFLQLHVMTLLLTIKRHGLPVYADPDPARDNDLPLSCCPTLSQEEVRSGNGISTDINAALHYIAQNYAMPLTLTEVAAAISLTPTYLSRKFKRVTGSTFKEYLNYIRIRQATRLLLSTEISVTEIAIRCGFNSSNYFKDCFRRINGVSPRTFRQQARQGDDRNGTNMEA